MLIAPHLAPALQSAILVRILLALIIQYLPVDIGLSPEID
jgi:hypothetical protein